MGMVVHNRIVLSMDTWEVLEDDSYIYAGEVTHCGGGGKGGGGGSTVNSVDYSYNDRMATIAEEQQNWARDYYNMWRNNGFRQYEIEQVQANRQALPYETNLYLNGLQNATDMAPYQQAATKTLMQGAKQQGDLYKQQIQAAKDLLPAQQKYAQTQLQNAQALQPMQHAINQKFLSQSNQGVDVLERMGLAQADVANSYKNADAASNRSLARMGVNPNSSRFVGTKTVENAQKAAQMAGARTTARVGAEQENYERLKNGIQFQNDLTGVGTMNQIGSEAGQGALQGASAYNSDIMQGIGTIRGGG